MLAKQTFFFIIFLCLSVGFPAAADPAMTEEQITIIVKGVEGEALENILTSLSLQKQKDHPRLSESRIRTLHKKANNEIKRALQALGYYKPEITTELKQTDQGWVANYLVDVGQALKIGKMDLVISGDAEHDESFSNLLDTLPLQQGKRFHHGQYESSKKDLQRLAATRGYLDAEFIESTVEVDLEAYTATITIHFETGTRYRFGRVEFSESPIRLDKLAQYQTFEEGDPYQNGQLIKFQQNLSNTDFFNDIEVRPLFDEKKDHTIPIKVTLTPRKRNRYTAGAGFGTDTGPRLKLGWSNRFNSQGHRMGADAKISPILSTLSAHYTIPHFRDRDAELGFNVITSREDTDTSKSNSINFGLNHRHKRWGWDETASLNYLYENFEISDEEETSKSLIPGIGWTKTETDNPAYTTNGYRLGFNIRGSIESFVSDITFVQASLNGKFIRTFWDNGRIIVRGNLGLTEVNSFEELPTSLRYFAGGDNSIRGFDYEDLGPRDDKGNVVGGKYLMVGSVEYEHRIKEKWAIAGFVDAGNSFNKFGGEIEVGTGFGVRWLSPVGLVRVDLAMGISEPDHPIRLHIVIGPDL